MRRRAVLLGAAASPLLATRTRAQAGLPTVRIGVLWDRSGAAAVTSGLDQLVAARLAIDDFGQFSRGYPIDLVDAEFQGRPDQAEDIARKWFADEDVAVILDLPGMAAPARVQKLARALNRSVINTGSFNSALAGALCSPTATHWLEDTRALTMAMTLGLKAEGMKTWYLVAPDDVIGQAFQRDAIAAIDAAGGRVLGSVQHPSDAPTFTSALTGARDSGADVVALCAMGAPLEAQIREARGLGLFEKPRAVCAYSGCIKNIHAMGPRETRDLWLVSGFYWNENETARRFSGRFKEITGRMPDMPYAATYAAAGDFLRIVESLDTIDGVALNVGLRQVPAYFFGRNGQVRIDGTVALDVGLYRVKPPDQVSEDWDYYKHVRTISANDIYRRVKHGDCSLSP